MKLFEAMRTLLDEGQQKEAEKILSDYRTLTTDEFLKKHKKFVNYVGERFFIDNRNANISVNIFIFYLTWIKIVEQTDWGGEENPGQIKRFLHSRLKKYGYMNVKLNDNIVKKMLANNQIERGEYIPMLLNCFDKQTLKLGLKTAVFDVGSDEYNIALIPLELFVTMENGIDDGYLRVCDTTIWELFVTGIVGDRIAAMRILMKKLNIPLSEIKTFITSFPIYIEKGMKEEIEKLKAEYEHAGCSAVIKEVENQYDF